MLRMVKSFHVNDEKRDPGRLGYNRGLYYPVIWGLFHKRGILKKKHEIRIPIFNNQHFMESKVFLPGFFGTCFVWFFLDFFKGFKGRRPRHR